MPPLFRVFDFLGFDKAPNANVDQYKTETLMGLYPPEIASTDGESSTELNLPWTYSPAQDAAACMSLVEELLHFIIILITELPPPSPQDNTEHAHEAKRRLKREVIHRLGKSHPCTW